MLDTSGEVPLPEDGIARVRPAHWAWPDLSPFVQGYVEALCRSGGGYNSASGEHEAWDFAQLAPDTLARIMEDCERVWQQHLRPTWGRSSKVAGAEFWAERQAWMRYFPPLTPYLGDDGKVRLQ